MDTNNQKTDDQQPVASPLASQLVIPPEVRSFIEGILEDAKMTTLDDEMKEEMVKELYVRLDSFLTSKIVENLPPEHMEAFMQMVDENKSQSELQEFLHEKMPNAPEAFARAFSDFREMYLYNVTAARQAPAPSDEGKTD